MIQICNYIIMQNLHGFHSPPSYSTSWPLSIANLDMLTTTVDAWKIAEKRVNEILSMIQPTLVSEHRREAIIEYMQVLIGYYCGIKQVYPIGSVPLKTYLPDGDIDLTALCDVDEEVLSRSLCSLLQNLERLNIYMRVSNIQCVPAQVKVVKCSVEKISVDISFNQRAGLCALTFLDQVDEMIGQDHLFKRSVILIKAWCFYESRILGSNFGLISSYALETMVLHIINLFHSSLHKPLIVLRKFLQYFSGFDWEQHCVAIDGLVLVSFLPEIVVQKPDGSDDMLLTAEFLRNSRDSFVHLTGIYQNGEQPYPGKFLNIIDPLRLNNNLGRCVNKANFRRIKAALSFGNRKLGYTLALPPEEITLGIDDFFQSTLEKNSGGRRRDASPLPQQGYITSRNASTTDENRDLLAGSQYGMWSHDFANEDLPMTIIEMVKSRGTGPYIPKPVYPPKKNLRPISSGEASISNGTDLCWQEKEEFGGTSLMDFPPLPSNKPVEIKANPPSLCWRSEKVTEASSSADNTEVGITKNAESGPPSPVQLQLPSVSPPIGDPPSAEDAKEEPKEKKKVSPTKPPIQLANMNEFPALPRFRLKDANEFPPLGGKTKKGGSKHRSKK